MQIACSIGFAIYPEAGTTAEQLFERADYALYHVKQHARGRSVVFSQEHEIQIRQFALVENCLRNADLEQELSINFQPIYDVVRCEVVAFEALARWDSPKLGPIPPDDFIPVAERTDFVSKLTRILLRKALACVRTWPDDIRISFNLSVRDISSAEAILKIIAIIENSGVAPERIDLEVTETALIRDFDKGNECLRALKSLGVHISLDDFGSGYSSLSYVHRLPLDKIKIDRSFIKDIETQGASRDIVKTDHRPLPEPETGVRRRGHGNQRAGGRGPRARRRDDARLSTSANPCAPAPFRAFSPPPLKRGRIARWRRSRGEFEAYPPPLMALAKMRTFASGEEC